TSPSRGRGASSSSPSGFRRSSGRARRTSWSRLPMRSGWPSAFRASRLTSATRTGISRSPSGAWARSTTGSPNGSEVGVFRCEGYTSGPMDVLVLIDKLDDLVHNAKAVPLTDQVRIDREEIYDILDQMRATIPEEIKQARWIVKE